MELTLHHYAFLTGDTLAWLKENESSIGAPYKVHDTTVIPSQKVNITFVEQKQGQTLIELVEPFEDNLSLKKMLGKGATLYHRGYYVDATFFDTVLKHFEENGAHVLPVFYSEAFNNNRCAFVMTANIGLIELIERTA